MGFEEDEYEVEGHEEEEEDDFDKDEHEEHARDDDDEERSSPKRVAATKAQKEKPKKEEDKRFIFIIQGDKASSVNPDAMNIISLPHPKYGTEAKYALIGDGFYEIQKYKRKHSSWFVDDRVIEDGSLYFVTKCDPLFVMLPVLDRVRMRNENNPLGYFCPITQIFTRETDQDEAFFQLKDCKGLNLALVCDTKEGGGETLYRLNDEKVVKWLCNKVFRISGALSKDTTFNRGQTSGHSKYFKKSLKAEQNEQQESSQSAGPRGNKDFYLNSIGILSEYVRKESGWLQQAAKLLDVNAEFIFAARAEQPVATEDSTDKRKYKVNKASPKKPADSKKRKDHLTPAPAMSRNVAKLAKANTKGIKSITSFFTKK